MLEYIKFPKIISKQDYDLNKNDFLEYKIVSKNNNNVILMNMQNLEDKSYWRMDEIANKIYKDNGKVIFMIIDNSEDEIKIIIGATNNSESLNVSFSKNTINIKEFSKRKKEILLKAKLIQNLYKNNDDIIVYSKQEKDLEIIKQLFPKGNFVNKSLESLLSKTKIHQNIKQKIMPFAIVFIAFFTLNFLGNSLIDNSLSKVKEKNKITKIKLESELKKERMKNKKLLKENNSFNNIQKKVLLLRNKIYYNKD